MGPVGNTATATPAVDTKSPMNSVASIGSLAFAGSAAPYHGLLLATWLSPAFPIGGFAYSHGLEWAIVEGGIDTPEAVASWIGDVLTLGAGWTDAVLLVEAWRATVDAEPARLASVAELAAALCPSQERGTESLSLGSAFLAAVAAAWPATSISEFADMVRATGGRDREGPAYPVAVGIAAAAHRLPLEATVGAFLNAQTQSLISVAVRFGIIGQTAGLRLLAGLQPLLLDQAARAAQSTLDDLGSAAVGSDLASMRHERQYTRLFRT